MSATPGFLADLFITGSGIAMSAEPLASPDDEVFTIVDDAKNIWDWTQALTVEVEDSPGDWVAAPAHRVNWLHGQIIFEAPVAVAVRVSGFFLPKFRWAKCRASDVTESTAELICTTFQDETVGRIYGLSDLSATITSLNILTTPNADGESSLRDILGDREFVVMSYSPDGEEDPLRSVVMFTSQSLSQPVDGLVEASLSVQSAAPNSITGQQLLSSQKE